MESWVLNVDDPRPSALEPDSCYAQHRFPSFVHSSLSPSQRTTAICKQVVDVLSFEHLSKLDALKAECFIEDTTMAGGSTSGVALHL